MTDQTGSPSRNYDLSIIDRALLTPLVRRVVRRALNSKAVGVIDGLGYGAFQLDENKFPWYEMSFGLPINELMSLCAKLNNYLLELADEARMLLGIV